MYHLFEKFVILFLDAGKQIIGHLLFFLTPSKNPSKLPVMCFPHKKNHLPHFQNQRYINS